MFTFQTILHPTDFSEHAHHAFRLACSLARTHGSRLIVLHVMERPAKSILGELVGSEGAIAERVELEERLHTVQPDDQGVPVDHFLIDGDAAASIVEMASDLNADLIVMGTRPRSALSRMVTRSVAESVVRNAGCPVVTIKYPMTERLADEESAAAASQPAPLQEMVTG